MRFLSHSPPVASAARLACLGALFLLSAGSARGGPLIYQESGGVVSMEAENFSSRTNFSATRGWFVVPDENAGSGTFSNATGGKYIQALPDGGTGGGGANVTPYVEYTMRITTTGEYRIFLRWDSKAGADAPGSDSLYASIVEKIDGVGAGTNADWYRFSRSGDANFATNPWHGSAGFEVTNAGGGDVNAVYNITTAGDITLRISMREDGAAVDKIVFQRSNLTAPTTTGPAVSQAVPAPPTALLAVVALAGLGAARWRRGRCSA